MGAWSRVVTDEAAYSQALKIAASAIIRARDVDDEYWSHARQWLVKALRLRGGFDDDQRVKEACSLCAKSLWSPKAP